jgi:hypothetical protein
MTNSNFKYRRTVSDICNSQDENHSNYLHTDGCSFLNSLQNIFNSPQIFLPSVLEVEIIFYKNNAIPISLGSLPNLIKLTFNNFGNSELISFELIKAIPKLSHLIYYNCLNIKELDLIKNWSNSKNIKLEIK